MCELLITVWPKATPIAQVLVWAEALERYGLGGFGWGVAFRDAGKVRHHRFPGRLADDEEGRAALAEVAATHYLVHLRRPSELSTIAMADTQPFLSDDQQFAFAHNGRLDGAEGMRARYAGRLLGRADSEVGFRLFEELLQAGESAQVALRSVHRELGGTANLGYFPVEGAPLIYCGGPANPLWRFRVGAVHVVSTGLHSSDQALFDFCFPSATDRQRLAVGEISQVGTEGLAGDGSAVLVGGR
ncbi:MAG: class II glutamine amidotransferase [Acidimicrobiales bacterium]